MEGNVDDPQTIASMLQDQLNAVDSEIRMIEEEKHNAKRVVDQLESQNWMDGLGYDDPSLYLPPGLSAARGQPRTSSYEYAIPNKYNTVMFVNPMFKILFLRCPRECRQTIHTRMGCINMALWETK